MRCMDDKAVRDGRRKRWEEELEEMGGGMGGGRDGGEGEVGGGTGGGGRDGRRERWGKERWEEGEIGGEMGGGRDGKRERWEEGGMGGGRDGRRERWEEGEMGGERDGRRERWEEGEMGGGERWEEGEMGGRRDGRRERWGEGLGEMGEHMWENDSLCLIHCNDSCSLTLQNNWYTFQVYAAVQLTSHTTTPYPELDDVSSNDHTHTLYEITDDMDEGCPHVDVLKHAASPLGWGSIGHTPSSPRVTFHFNIISTATTVSLVLMTTILVVEVTTLSTSPERVFVTMPPSMAMSMA